MAGFVYLIRNGDLHKIGRTHNLEKRLKQLKPDEVVQVLETDRSRDLEYELHQQFKDKRLPQTEYFRLDEAEVERARMALGWEPGDGRKYVSPEEAEANATMKDGFQLFARISAFTGCLFLALKLEEFFGLNGDESVLYGFTALFFFLSLLVMLYAGYLGAKLVFLIIVGFVLGEKE